MVIYSCFFMVGEKFLYLQAPKTGVVDARRRLRMERLFGSSDFGERGIL
jgi:hypothetical protein